MSQHQTVTGPTVMVCVMDVNQYNSTVLHVVTIHITDGAVRTPNTDNTSLERLHRIPRQSRCSFDNGQHLQFQGRQ